MMEIAFVEQRIDIFYEQFRLSVFGKVDWKMSTYYHGLLRFQPKGYFYIMRNWKERLLKSLTVESVQGESERFDRIQVASCVILLEVAKFDFDFSSIEKETTKAILKNEFAIPEDAIEDLMKISEEKREDSVDLWEFTNVINKNFPREAKIKIIEAAWKIIYADDKLDKYENHYVHILSDLLRLRHDELIDAKLNVLYGDQSEKEEDQENDDDDDKE